MHIEAEAIICAVRAHGEHGAIVRAMTAEHGLLSGYVRGGHSRRLRPVLIPANVVMAGFRARTEEQLAGLTVELVHSRAPLMGEPLAAAALDWATALTASTLPEAQPYPHLHTALDGVLGAIEAAPAARGWAVALVRYELLLLAEMGFGLDLERCAVTDSSEELVWVSPKSGRAVSAVAGQDYADKLLRFPRFLSEGGEADWDAIFDGLRLTGHFLSRDILIDRRADVAAARERLVERLKRAVA
ncbi:DNA repair protein RecO [Sphingomonas sp. LaA6.9]|uniref:DNA repair protein RecO n=1 Tax=Sphingomonas sp. LaA6.9 TaxID=2919914 RepID=UPI001F4FEABA|nr:DNA repair protein RecO [Sphingomonas sp. LaA6.9]MCJ8155800.1 DNA repair protein RecO [Sphingomonas sp. LaA6.9]